MLHVTDLSVYRASFVLSAAVSISYVFFVLCSDSELLFTVVLCKSQVIAVPAQSSSSSHITDFTASSRVFLKKKTSSTPQPTSTPLSNAGTADSTALPVPFTPQSHYRAARALVEIRSDGNSTTPAACFVVRGRERDGRTGSAPTHDLVRLSEPLVSAPTRTESMCFLEENLTAP
jgi:hypothetical protein